MKSAFVFPVSSCALLGVVMVLHGAAWAQPVAPVTRETAEEAAADAMEAYIYGYPLVTMEMTRRVMTNVAAPTGKLAPMGRFAHLRSYPSPTDKEVTAPNADTLYSLAWLDLAAEPYVLSVPDSAGRYYLMPLLSGWTDVFEVPGKRTTGTGPQTYLITGPGWKGTVPGGTVELASPTNMVWIVGRTYCTGTPEDYQAVHRFQDQIALVPLSAYGKPYTPPPGKVDPTVDMKTPVRDQVNRMSATAYFKLLAALMKDNPPSEEDASVVAAMAKIGIVAGQDFDIKKLEPAAAAAVEGTPQAAWKRIMAEAQHMGTTVNGWHFSLETGLYGTDYLQRAVVAAIGLGANRPEDAIYPYTQVDGEGKRLSGGNKYVLRFPRGELPPVNGFWSLTMYDPSFFFVPNPIDRFSISPRTSPRANADGSVDIYIQNESPGKDKESNWLPAPRGEFTLMLRMYWPQEPVLDESWYPPAVLKAERIADGEAIRELALAFSRAYDKGDAQAVAALFTEDAEAAHEAGTVVRGREAIRAHFAKVFAENPGEKIEVLPESVVFLGPDLARETGHSRTMPMGDGTPEISRYSVLLVRRNGRWLQASVQESPPQAEPGLTPHERLKELEWLLGEWVDESEAGVVHTSCRWSDDHNYLLRDYKLHVAGQPAMGGSQRIGWDPLTSQFKSWVFDSDGGYSEGHWTRSGDDQWTIKISGVLADGRTFSVTHLLTLVNKAMLRWRSVDRAVAGEAWPDLPEVILVRTPPSPGSRPARPR